MKKIWDVSTLAQYWDLNSKELQFVQSKSIRNQLALSAQLKYYQNLGGFPARTDDIPVAQLHYLANQLQANLEQLHAYNWLDKISKLQQKEILHFLGIRKALAADKEAFANWLIDTVYPRGFSTTDVIVSAFKWFHRQRIQCPGNEELKRLISSAYRQFELNLSEHANSCLSQENKRLINNHLLGSEDW